MGTPPKGTPDNGAVSSILNALARSIPNPLTEYHFKKTDTPTVRYGAIASFLRLSSIPFPMRNKCTWTAKMTCPLTAVCDRLIHNALGAIQTLGYLHGDNLSTF